MNNQAAQTMPALVDRVRECHAAWAAYNAVAPGEDRAVGTEKLLTEVLAALSQTAGVAEGSVMVPVEPTLDMLNAGWGVLTSIGVDPETVEMAPIYAAMLAAAPAASGGEDAGYFIDGKPVSEDCHDGFLDGASRVAARMQGQRDASASQSSNPNPVTPGLSSESGASVSERARVSLDLNNLPAEWPWDEGSPCLDPRPVGMVYPAVPTPRAFGYLDKSGVEWAAYDTGQMEEYGRRAFADGANTVLHAVDQPVNDLWSSDAYRRGWSDCAMTNGLTLEQALTQQRGPEDVEPFGHAMYNTKGACVGFRQNTGFGYNFTVADFMRADKIMPHGAPHIGRLVYATTPQPGAEALRELVQRWRKGGHPFVLECAYELESLLARGG